MNIDHFVSATNANAANITIFSDGLWFNYISATQVGIVRPQGHDPAIDLNILLQMYMRSLEDRKLWPYEALYTTY